MLKSISLANFLNVDVGCYITRQSSLFKAQALLCLFYLRPHKCFLILVKIKPKPLILVLKAQHNLVPACLSHLICYHFSPYCTSPPEPLVPWMCQHCSCLGSLCFLSPLPGWLLSYLFICVPPFDYSHACPNVTSERGCPWRLFWNQCLTFIPNLDLCFLQSKSHYIKFYFCACMRTRAHTHGLVSLQKVITLRAKT